MITNKKLHINNTMNGNGHINDDHDDDGDSDELKVLKNLQALAPEIKKHLILTSQHFTQFITYMEDFDRLIAKIQSIQTNQKKIEKQLEGDLDNRIYLDVGGQRFTTTIRTLTKQSKSFYFETLIMEKWNSKTNSNENPIFIDRDGRLFDFVLKYLRTGEINVDDKTIQRELLTEAKYYTLKSLEDILTAMLGKEDFLLSSSPCSPLLISNKCRSSPHTLTRQSSLNQLVPSKSKVHPAQTASSWRSNTTVENRINMFFGSNLVTFEYEEKLLEFLGDDYQEHQWRLVYRASEHGFDASDFHRHCDGLAPTLSIIQTDFGNIFGGFTSVPWSSALVRTDQPDSKAFLFTLRNTLNVPPTKFPVANEYQQCAISHNPTCGPNFGSPKNEGSDLCLRSKFNEKNNCIFFPKSYIDPTNHGGFIFAKKYFACKEVEVFTLMNIS